MIRRPPLSARELREQSLPRRNLGLRESAVYVGVSERLFTTLVKQGRLPAPRLISTGKSQVRKWDIRELDESVDRLPHAGDSASTPAQPRRLFRL